MNSETYLDQLRFHLAGRMPVNEMERVLQYYREQMIRQQDGGAAVAQEWGDPQKLADDLVDDYLNLKSEHERRNAPKKKNRRWLPFIGILALAGVLSSFVINYVAPFTYYHNNTHTIREVAVVDERATSSVDVQFAQEGTWASNGAEGYFNETVNQGNTMELALPGLSNLDINLSAADVSIIPGDAYGVSISHKSGAPEIQFTYDNGNVYVTDSTGSLFSFDTGKQISSVTFTVPAGAYGEYLYLDSDFGTISLDGYSIKGEAMIYSSSGNISVSNLTAGSLYVDVDFGKLDMAHVQAQDSLSIYADAGSVSLSDITAGSADLNLSFGDLTLTDTRFDSLYVDSDAGAVTGNNLQTNYLALDCDFGDVNLQGTFNNYVDVDADAGKVSLQTTNFLDDHMLDISNDFGGIYINGSRQHTSSLSTGQGAHQFYIDADFGEVHLNFDS